MTFFKKILQIISVMIVLACNSIEVFSIELQPINENYKGVETKNDTIAIWDDYGSMILSFDNAKSWKQIKVFETGTIVKLYFEDNRITTFNNFGQISISTDNGKNWVERTDLRDTVLSVLKLEEGYLVRLDDKLVLLTESFQIKEETVLRSNFHPGLNELSYINAMTKFKENFVISTFGANFIVFNKELNPIDTINMKERGLCDNCSFLSRILSDNDNVYVSGVYTIHKSSDFIIFDTIYQTTEFVTRFNLIDGTIYRMSLYKALKFELCKITSDTILTVAKYKGKEKTRNISVNDYKISKDRLILVGDYKLIIIHDFKKDTTELVSEFSGHSSRLLPDAINDSTFLFYSGSTSPYKIYGTFSSMLYKTDNKGVTFKNSININNNPDIWGYQIFYYKYFDSVKNLLYYGGRDYYHEETGGFIVSSDFGDNFDFIPIKNFVFGTQEISNLQRKDNSFVTAINFSYNGLNKRGSYLYTFDDNFAVLDTFSFDNYIVRHQHSFNANTCLFLSENKLESINEINFTTDKGKNFEVIKKYDKYDSLLYYNEYVTKGINYLYMCFYNIQDSIIRFEALNIADRTVHLIYTYKALKDEVYDIILNTAFDSDGELFYLAVKDTLFHIDDIYASKHTDYNILPNNGRITRALKKYGNTFYVYYKDSINPHNIYWMKLPEIIKLKPEILAEDFDFGKHDIKDNNFKTAKIKINNLSDEAELVITGYTISDNSVFITDLPEMEELNPLKIKEGQHYEFNVVFKPNEVGIFKDSIVFISNADEIDFTSNLSGEGIDSLDTSIDNEVEYKNYLYSYPPYPLPALNEVRSLIYWDPGLDIDIEQITIYNIYGTKIPTHDKIRIDKLTNYSGNLIWDCSGVETGIYVIHLKHGTESRIIKVIVTK